MKPSDLLNEPRAWTQNVCARDALGNSVGPDDPTAKKWCMLGAISRARYGHRLHVLQSIVGESVIAWNDNYKRTHAEVLAALKAAGL